MRSSEHASVWVPTPSDRDRYVGPYRLVRQIGAGGMGIVHLAVDPVDRPVAVKVLRPFIAEDLQARARLAREVETLQRVRHRCVAAVVDADLDGADPYLVTEFVDGPQLDRYVDDVGPLSDHALANLGRSLIGALGAIHEAGIVHRDLKPANVMLQGDRALVIDFGIAQAADDIRLTATGLFVGTPGYVAPEVISGGRASPATDWWGFAAVLAFAATGRSPAGTGPVPVVLDRIRGGLRDLDGVPAGLRELLRACLDPDPQHRPPAAEIRRRFEAFAAPAPQPPAAPVTIEGSGLLRRVARTFTAARPRTPVTPPPTGRPLPTRLSPRLDPGPADTGPRSDVVRRRLARLVDRPESEPRGTAAVLWSAALLFAVLGTGWPVIGLLLFLGVVVLVRFADAVRQNAERGRPARGRFGSLLRRTALSPWLLFTSTVRSLAGVGVAALAGTAVAAGGLGLVRAFGVPAGPGHPAKNVVLLLAALVVLTVTWRGPSGPSLRGSAGRVLRRVAPTSTAVLVLTIAVTLAALVLLLLVLAFPAIVWWPV